MKAVDGFTLYRNMTELFNHLHPVDAAGGDSTGGLS